MPELKHKIKSGQAVHGCWLNTGSAVSAEIVGMAGFDWLLLDLEHGAGSERELLAQLQALQGSPASPLVRVESAARPRSQRVLDMGARGIMYPQIQSTEEAQAAVEGMYYPPHGRRGAAYMVRATGYGGDFDTYSKQLKDQLVSMVQIETVGALKAVKEIAALPLVDVLFVGPSDLSLALGVFGQWQHPRFEEALKATATAARQAGKAAGVLLHRPGQYEYYYELGYRVLACGSDATFIASGSQAMAAELAASRKQAAN